MASENGNPTVSTNADDFLTAAIILLLMLSALCVRVWGLGAWDYHVDEIWHVYISRQPTLADIFYSDLTEDGHPLLPYALWHYMLGIRNDPWMARLPSLVAGILCVPMGYVVGRELFASRNGGLFFAFFMAFSGVMIEQSDVVRGYALMLLAVLVAVWSTYRYSRCYRLAYLLVYFLSMGTAFFCEFAVAPVAGFTALHLACSIYRQPCRRFVAAGLWAVIHLALLAYLLCFMHLLHDIGTLGSGTAQDVFFIFPSPPAERAFKIALYLANAALQFSFFYLPALATRSLGLMGLCLIGFSCISIAGFAWLIRYRKWSLLLLALFPIACTAVFYYLGLVSLYATRRNMGLALSMAVLFYAGFSYLFRDGLRHRQWHKSTVPAALVVLTGLLCLSYAVCGGQWRALQPLEFQQTHKQSEAVFHFMDQHIGARDIIITDWYSYLYFWEKKPCAATPVSSRIQYYACYRVPVFILSKEDPRNSISNFSLTELQQTVQELYRLQKFKNIQTVWLAGILGGSKNVLSLHYRRELSGFLPLARQKDYGQEWVRAIHEQESFARQAYGAASYRKIIYNNSYHCPLRGDEVLVGGKDDCELNTVLIALPEKWIYRQLVNHPPYYDVVPLLNRMEDPHNTP